MDVFENRNFRKEIKRILVKYSPNGSQIQESLYNIFEDYGVYLTYRNQPAKRPQKANYRRKECQDFHALHGDLKRN